MSNYITDIQLSGVTYTLSAQTSGGIVSSAITSGDTNAVAGGAVYDKVTVDKTIVQWTSAYTGTSDSTVKIEIGTGHTMFDIYSDISQGNTFFYSFYDAEENVIVEWQMLNPEMTLTISSALTESGEEETIIPANNHYLFSSSALTQVASYGIWQYNGNEYTASMKWGKNATEKAWVNDEVDNLNTVVGRFEKIAISAGTGANSIIENDGSNTAGGTGSNAEGSGNTANGNYAHAEGNSTLASGDFSHAEGQETSATSIGSHAEGQYSKANENYAHAEGNSTLANNFYSHAEGYMSVADGYASHAEGYNTSAQTYYEHASGAYNVTSKASINFGDSGNTLFSVGNGNWSNRHNAFEIRQNGDIYYTSGGTYDVTSPQIKLQDAIASKQDTLSAGTGISISGNVISATGGGGNPTVELTQAEYDALVSAGTVSADTYYIITDAQAGDLTQYWTSAQTQSAITQATSGKVDTTTFNTYSGSVETALSGKQDTLVSGTNIKTINNTSILGSGNIDIQGGGGGKAVSAGTNISITTGETADTINCTLPISVHSNTTKGDILFGTDVGSLSDYKRLIIGRNVGTRASSGLGDSIGINIGETSELYGSYSVGIGNGFKIGNGSQYSNLVRNCVAIGYGAKTRINNAVAIGKDTEASGTTQTNINNQLTIDTSNQVYIYNKDNTEMICLQDHLGGGEVSSAITSGDTNPVQGGVLYNKFDEVEQVTARALTQLSEGQEVAARALVDLDDRFGGLKLVKLTQSEYNSLQTKDSNTLYIIVN